MAFLNKQTLSLIIFLIPTSFVIGIALTELIVFLSILLFFIFNRDWSLYLEKKIIFLLIFSFYIFLNAKLQILDNLKFSSYLHFRFVFLSLSIIYFCQIIQRSNKNLFLLLVSPIFLILFDVIFQFFSGANLLGFQIINGRISSFFNDELVLGSFLVRLWPIIIWAMFFFNIDLKKNFFYIIIFFSFYLISIYLSAERTSFFLSIIFIFGIFLFIQSLRKIFVVSITAFLIFAFSISNFKIGNVDPSGRIILKTFNQITNYKYTEIDRTKHGLDTKNYKVFSNTHEGHIILSLNLFNENKIFGIGPKGFRYYCRSVEYDPPLGVCSTHPHNISIQILTELGLIGLIFYCISGLFVLYNFFGPILRKKFSNEYLAFYSAALGLYINLFPLIPGGNFFNNWISIMLYFNIGFYLYSYKKCINK